MTSFIHWYEKENRSVQMHSDFQKIFVRKMFEKKKKQNIQWLNRVEKSPWPLYVNFHITHSTAINTTLKTKFRIENVSF